MDLFLYCSLGMRGLCLFRGLRRLRFEGVLSLSLGSLGGGSLKLGRDRGRCLGQRSWRRLGGLFC